MKKHNTKYQAIEQNKIEDKTKVSRITLLMIEILYKTRLSNVSYFIRIKA